MFSTAFINDTGTVFIAPGEYYHTYYNCEIFLCREIHYQTYSIERLNSGNIETKYLCQMIASDNLLQQVISNYW